MDESTDSICRLCLQKLIDNKSFDIFPKKSDGEHENVIAMRLAAVAAIEVIKFDALPKKICQSCRYQLELSYSFRKKSQICDAKLRKHYKLLSLGKRSNVLSCEDDDQEEIYEDSLRFLEDFERIREEDLRNQLRAELETEAQERLEQLKSELQEELTETLRCELAKEIEEEFRNNEHHRIEAQCLAKAKAEFQNEMLENCRQTESKALINDLEEFLRIKQSERNKASTILLLEDAETKNDFNEKMQHNNIEITNIKKSKRKESLSTKSSKVLLQQKKDHLINKQVQQTKNVCKDVMSYEIRMNDMNTDESDDGVAENIDEVAVLNYDEIDEEFSGDRDDVLEILKVLNYEPGEADSRKESPVNDNKRKNHNRTERSESGNKSPTITYVCVDSSNKPPVGRSTTTPKVFKCKLCPVEVSTECSLQRHLRVHLNGEKSVACPECKIVVSCASALKRHMVVHSGERPYVCGVCNKAFGQKEILKRHENTQHKGLRRHKCNQCEKVFSQKINLTHHIQQQHLGEPRRRYKCHLCSKSFFFSSGLSRHLSFHSGITYQCSECVRTFTDRSSIKRHVLKVHGIERAKEILTDIDSKMSQH